MDEILKENVIGSVAEYAMLACGKCGKVKRSTLLSGCCASPLCQQCSKHTTCSLCGKTGMRAIHSKLLNEISKKVQVRCQNWQSGCDIVNSIAVVGEHQSNCSFKQRLCLLCNTVCLVNSASHLEHCGLELDCVCGTKLKGFKSIEEHLARCTPSAEIEQIFNSSLFYCKSCDLILPESHKCSSSREEKLMLSLKEIQRLLEDLKLAAGDKFSDKIESTIDKMTQEAKERSKSISSIICTRVENQENTLKSNEVKRKGLEERAQTLKKEVEALEVDLNMLDLSVFSSDQSKIITAILENKVESITQSTEFFRHIIV